MKNNMIFIKELTHRNFFLAIFFSIISFSIFNTSGYSQIDLANENVATDFIKATDKIFSKLNRNNIPSGILIDKTPLLSNLYQYDGLNPNMIINKDTILQVYSELYYAFFDKDWKKDVFTFYDNAKEFSKTNDNVIPLGLVFCDYQKFLPGSFENGNLMIQDKYIYEKPGTSKPPYSTEIVVAMSPLLDISDESDFISFEINNDFILSNRKYTKIQMRVEGELIWYNINPDDQITIANTLSSEDIILNFRIFSNDQIFYSKAIIPKIEESKTEIPEPDDTGNLSDGSQYGIWLGCNNNDIRKPIVIIEGYDPQNIRDFEINNEDNNLYNLMNQQNMADDFRAMGYDIIILNFDDSHNPIEHQAGIAQEYFNEINNRLAANNSFQELILIAPSQAGLVSRYALCTMENNNIDHRVKLFITFDTPHKGANIPLSLQHFFRFLSKSFPIFWLNKIKEGKEILDTTPTKQMLVYHYSETHNNLPNPAPEFFNFYENLNNLNLNGGYPTKCRIIAIANGSANGTENNFNPGDKLFSVVGYYGIYSLICNGFALPDHEEHHLFDGIVSVFNIPINFTIDKIKETLPYDNCAAGTNTAVSDIMSELAPYVETATSFYDNFSFIPTVSALDIKNYDFLNYNFYSIFNNQEYAYRLPSSMFPFEAAYISLENEPHVVDGVTSEIVGFVEDNIMPENLFLQDREISGKAEFEALNNLKAGKEVSNLLFENDLILSNDADVSFEAGNKINFMPGFKTNLGAHFTAIIEDHSCNKKINPEQRANNSEYLSSKGVNLLKNIINESEDVETIYPNPTKGIFNISANKLFIGNYTFEIININGEIVKSGAIIINNNSEFSFDISDQPDGFYFIKLNSESEIKTYKISKM